MRGAMLIGTLALAAGCTGPVDATATCETFVDAWADYDVRCGLTAAPSSDGATDADVARIEMDFFGAEGCATATEADFRDSTSLREECVPALEELECDATSVPEACADQIRR